MAELEQLALDPLVAPAVVLGGEPFDERGDLGADRRPSGPVRVSPFPGDQAAVPERLAASCAGWGIYPQPATQLRGGGEAFAAPTGRRRRPRQGHDRAAQGRPGYHLVPGCRLCIVYVAKVVELVPEASPAWQRAGGPPLTWISGPSATSDLELKRAGACAPGAPSKLSSPAFNIRRAGLVFRRVRGDVQ